MKLTMMVVALTLLAVLGGFPLVHAEVPEECRRQCALDLEAPAGTRASTAATSTAASGTATPPKRTA